MGQGHARIQRGVGGERGSGPPLMESENYNGLESSMLHTDFRENQPAGSGEEDF